jgi:hypothetical protein
MQMFEEFRDRKSFKKQVEANFASLMNLLQEGDHDFKICFCLPHSLEEAVVEELFKIFRAADKMGYDKFSFPSEMILVCHDSEQTEKVLEIIENLRLKGSIDHIEGLVGITSKPTNNDQSMEPLKRWAYEVPPFQKSLLTKENLSKLATGQDLSSHKVSPFQNSLLTKENVSKLATGQDLNSPAAYMNAWVNNSIPKVFTVQTQEILDQSFKLNLDNVFIIMPHPDTLDQKLQETVINLDKYTQENKTTGQQYLIFQDNGLWYYSELGCFGEPQPYPLALGQLLSFYEILEKKSVTLYSDGNQVIDFSETGIIIPSFMNMTVIYQLNFQTMHALHIFGINAHNYLTIKQVTNNDLMKFEKQKIKPDHQESERQRQNKTDQEFELEYIDDKRDFEENAEIDELQMCEVRGYCEHLDHGLKIIADKIKSKFIQHNIPVKTVSSGIQNILRAICKRHNLTASFEDSLITLEGNKNTVNKIRNEIIKTATIKFDSEIPREWQEMHDKKYHEVQLCTTIYTKEEYFTIESLLRESMPHIVIKGIVRIQNKNLWQNYCYERKRMKENGYCDELLLFHGTRANNPSLICKGTEEGFDVRLAKTGSWGKGIYFAEDASYCSTFAYIQGGRKFIIAALVLIGNSYTLPSGQSIVRPPDIPGTNKRYDSVTGHRLAQIMDHERIENASQAVSGVMSMGKRGRGAFYIIYNNNKAYPYYLIEYV